MSKIKICDLSTHGSNYQSEIKELSEKELNLKGGLPWLWGVRLLLLSANAY